MDLILDSMIERIRAAAAQRPRRCASAAAAARISTASRAQGELLDTRPLAGITSYEPSELVVTVRAGTPLAELEAVLAEQGQCLPFEPPHFARRRDRGRHGRRGPERARPAPASARCATSCWGSRMVNGRGELLTFGGQVMKNVAGYDVSRLMAGSLGTLGLIAEVSLKVLPVAPAEATLEFELSQADALRLLNEWGGRPLPLNASVLARDARCGRAVPAPARRGGCGRSGLRAPGRRAPGQRPQAAAGLAVAAATSACRGSTGAASAISGGCRCRRPRRCWTCPSTPLIEWHGGQRWVRAGPGEATALARGGRAPPAATRRCSCAAGNHAAPCRRFDAAERRRSSASTAS